MALRSILGLILAIATIFLLFAACSDDDSPTDSNDSPPASIAVTPTQLDFSPSTTQLMLLISNSGSGTLLWECDTAADLVSCSPSSGSLTTEVDTVAVTANREGLLWGNYFDTLSISSNGGSVAVPIVVGVGLEPLPSLLGEYSGEYVYIENYGTTNETSTWDVILRFSDQNYWLFDNSSSTDVCICQPSGTYVVAGSVELQPIVDGCASCVFDPDKLPYGSFTLRQPTDPNTGLDSLILTQINTYSHICKLIRLVPVSN